MTVAGGTNLYIQKLQSGKIDVTTTQPTSNGTEISPTKLAALLNTVLVLNLLITPDKAKDLIVLLSKLDVGEAGNSPLDKLIDGVSQIGSGEKHFSEEGLIAVKSAVEEWINDSKQETMKALSDALSSESNWDNNAPPQGSKITVSVDFDDFCKSMIVVEQAPTPPPVDGKFSDPGSAANTSMPMELFIAKVICGSDFTEEESIKPLPAEVDAIFQGITIDGVLLSKEAKVAMLRLLGETGYLGKTDDYTATNKGVFADKGKEVTVSYMGGRKFLSKFFQGNESTSKGTVNSVNLHDAIKAMTYSFESLQIVGEATDLGAFAVAFVTAPSYSERTRGQTADQSATNISAKFNGKVAKEHMSGLAGEFIKLNPTQQSLTPNGIRSNDIQIARNKSSGKVQLAVKNDQKYDVVMEFDYSEWNKFLKYYGEKSVPDTSEDKDKKKTMFLNFLELMMQKPKNAPLGPTIITDGSVKVDEVTEIVPGGATGTGTTASTRGQAGATGGTGQGANQQVTELSSIVANGTATLKELCGSVLKFQDGVVLTQTVTIKKDYVEKIGIDVGNWGDTSSKEVTLEEVARAVISKYDALNKEIFIALNLTKSTLQQKYDAIQSLIKDTGFGLEDYKVKVTIPATPPATPTTPTTQEITVQQYLQGQLSEQIKGRIQARIPTTTSSTPYKGTQEAKDDCALAGKLGITEIELTPAQATAIGFSQIESKKSYSLAEIIAKLAPSEATPAAPAQQVQPVAVTSETPAPAGTAPVDLVKLNPGVSVVSGAEIQLNQILSAKSGQTIPPDLTVTITTGSSEVLIAKSFSAAKYAFESGKAYTFTFSSQSNSTATYNPFTRTF